MADDNPIVQLSPIQLTPELKALFVATDPAALRCQAVLNGHAAGIIYTDHPETPCWGVLQEAAFGSIYLGGEVQAVFLHQLIGSLRQSGEVLVGMPADDPRWRLFPGGADYSGHTLEFTDREAAPELPVIPPGCELRRLDAILAKEILDRNLLIRMFGSISQALTWGYGLCLLRDNSLLCEAFAGPAANGVIEIGVETQPHHMSKGYAFITCSHLIYWMEQLGFQTYWNCATGNIASSKLARKLGYHTQREYRLLAWSQLDV
jgi:hypothetical protein